MPADNLTTIRSQDAVLTENISVFPWYNLKTGWQIKVVFTTKCTSYGCIL